MSRRKRPCLGRPGYRCPELTTNPKGRCPECMSAWERNRGSSTARGYGTEHRKLRETWLPYVKSGGLVCARPGCDRVIAPDEPWDLGHTSDRGATGGPKYRGPEHRSCNRATRSIKSVERALDARLAADRDPGGPTTTVTTAYQSPSCPF